MPFLFVLSAAAFVSAFSIRILDPLVPSIARDLGVTIGAAAMLAPAYTFPYALSQPILGALGDRFGKTTIIKICTAVLAIALLVSIVATDYSVLFVARCVAGIGGGGMIPIAFAIIGDRFAVSERQVALARLVMASQMAILMSASLSGVLAARFGWRAAFVLAGTVAAISFLLMLKGLPAEPSPKDSPRLDYQTLKDQYANVLRGPMARYILPAAMLEGIALFGFLPFVAHRLELRGLGGLEEAGFVLAALSIGGICYTTLVGPLLKRLGRTGLIRVGGTLVFLPLLGLAVSQSWQMEAILFAVLGFGFFMIHNSLQLLATELMPAARASSVALFACCFFLGQAFGPMLYYVGFGTLGLAGPLIIAAILFLFMAFGLAALLDKGVPQL
jgi:MFS transporter, DHA1 family, inner membrane transport protein